jgi:glycosyltransferase involved in cell wall biosynthesis
MKKVLIIQQIIPHYRIDFFNLLRAELAKDNIELNVVYGKSSTTYKSGAEFNELEWGKIVENKIIRIGATHLTWQPIVKYLKGQDLVIVGRSNKLLINYYLIIARKFGKFKLGFWGHGRNLQARSDSWSNKFGLLFLKECDWWFAYTNSVREYLISNNFSRKKISVLENAIDTKTLQLQYQQISDDMIQNIKNQLGIQGEHVAIFCGGMYANKRMDFLLETCYRIKKSIPDFYMIFVGTGEEAYKIEKAADNHEWIHYVGPKKGLDRVIYFKIASVQLMPGLVGLGILDSFALQTPIITTNYEYHSPEVDYLINGQNGIITTNTLDDYSSSVIEIFKNDKYLDLIEGCQISAQIYTVEKMVSNFKCGILQCLGLSNSDSSF